MSKYIWILFSFFIIGSTSAIRITVPPSDGNRDVAVTWPTQIESNGDLVLNYIKLINEYLWIAMVMLSFAVFIRIGFKLFTNEAGTDGAKDVLKNGLIALWAGLMIILFSYTIVRVVINII